LCMASWVWKNTLLMSVGLIWINTKSRRKQNMRKVGSVEREKKENNVSPFHYWFFFGQNPYKPNDPSQKMFIKDLVMLIAKGYMLLYLLLKILGCIILYSTMQ
jgi:hypothetical protein